MKPQSHWPQFFILWICLSLTGCYYTRDIQNQTIGSFAGGADAGLLIAKAGGSLAGISAGVIGGSIIGSMVGQHYDDHNPFMRENPLTSPVHRYAYVMLRPTLEVACFNPGNIRYDHQCSLPYLTNNPPTVNTLDFREVHLSCRRMTS